jgi:hypothetical protein
MAIHLPLTDFLPIAYTTESSGACGVSQALPELAAQSRVESTYPLATKIRPPLDPIVKMSILFAVRYLIPFGRARVSAPPVPAISMRPLQILPHL